MKTLHIVCALLLLLLGPSPSSAADLKDLAPMLKQGGYVLVFRHGATDESQKDVYPFNFDDMKAQRQLSDKGREMARQIGAAIKKLGIPIGEIYTSRLNRAIETGKLLSGKDVRPVDALTDSSAGSTSGMANPSGGNAKDRGTATGKCCTQSRCQHFARYPQDEYHGCIRKRGERCAGRGSVRLQA